MNPGKILTLKEKDKPRLFIINEMSDYNKAALRILRERNSNKMYPKPSDVRQALQEDLIALQRIHATDSKEYPAMVDDLTQYYKIILEFSVKLEELLSLPKQDALDLDWKFDDGGTAPLAYTLLSMRRNMEYEGYSITETESF